MFLRLSSSLGGFNNVPCRKPDAIGGRSLGTNANVNRRQA